MRGICHDFLENVSLSTKGEAVLSRGERCSSGSVQKGHCMYLSYRVARQEPGVYDRSPRRGWPTSRYRWRFCSVDSKRCWTACRLIVGPRGSNAAAHECFGMPCQVDAQRSSTSCTTFVVIPANQGPLSTARQVPVNGDRLRGFEPDDLCIHVTLFVVGHLLSWRPCNVGSQKLRRFERRNSDVSATEISQ